MSLEQVGWVRPEARLPSATRELLQRQLVQARPMEQAQQLLFA